MAPHDYSRINSDDVLNDTSRFLQMLKMQIENNLKAHGGDGEADVMCKEDAFDLSFFTSQAQFEKEMAEEGLKVKHLFHNSCTAILYEEALKHERGSYITKSGALAVSSGKKTGRSPGDKRIVEQNFKCPGVADDIWWGKVNIPLKQTSFSANRERAIDYLNTREQLYVVDAYAGWSEKHRIKVRVITSRAYHALFMQNMLVLPTEEELRSFHPDFVIYNAGEFPANRCTVGMSSRTSVCLSFEAMEMVILGTEYAGEMKKGILTLMMYLMPKQGALPLHSSCNVGRKENDVTLFFGLSGTGKTTLSADPLRNLLGDDEHVWTDSGVFNIEGGCYAKAVDLTEEQEPEIFRAIRFGAVLENVVFDSHTRDVDYSDTSVTENTRASYPLNHIPNALIPAVVNCHPKVVVLLTCDAFGVLPPVSLLSPEQVQYYFISGYTAKVAGTEQGITEPQATFSSCFGSPFLVWHPIVYARMLAEKISKHKCQAYLLNTGWIGGGYGEGKRCSLKYTRKMIDAMHDGSFRAAIAAGIEKNFDQTPILNLRIPKQVNGVPASLLNPRAAWANVEKYDNQQKKLAGLFIENFKKYESQCPDEVRMAGPQL